MNQIEFVADSNICRPCALGEMRKQWKSAKEDDETPLPVGW
jgi:hypothetical protein